MEKLIRTNKKRLLISTGLFILAYFVLLQPMDTAMVKAGTGVTPDSWIGYDLEFLKSTKALYGADVTRTYVLTRFTFDLLWPLVYMFFFINLLGLTMVNISRKRDLSWIKFLPLIGGMFDYIENMLCSIYLSIESPDILGIMASMSSGLKWLVLFASMVLILLFACVKIRRRMKTFVGSSVEKNGEV